MSCSCNPSDLIYKKQDYPLRSLLLCLCNDEIHNLVCLFCSHHHLPPYIKWVTILFTWDLQKCSFQACLCEDSDEKKVDDIWNHPKVVEFIYQNQPVNRNRDLINRELSHQGIIRMLRSDRVRELENMKKLLREQEERLYWIKYFVCKKMFELRNALCIPSLLEMFSAVLVSAQ